MRIKVLSVLAAVVVVMIACNKPQDEFGADYKRPTLPDEPYPYSLEDNVVPVPDHISFPNNNNLHEITNEIATLGRVLFYDKALSLNNRTACASCHKQTKGFADKSAQSSGFNIGQTRRNSPSCVNMIFSNSFFWDGRAHTLEQQVVMPIADHLEMGLSDTNYMVQKLALLDYYAPLFTDAYGTPEVTKDRISTALAQFLRCLVSVNSKYDEGVAIDFANFSQLELEGYQLFSEGVKAPCISCHGGQAFNGWGGSYANIGLEMSYADGGQGELFNDPQHEGLFKVPTLRNVELTAPYMHDGRFATLEEVVEHYDNGVVPHANLDWRMTNQSFMPWFDGDVEDFIAATGLNPTEPRRLNLTDREKQALVAFLKTLTDDGLMIDQRFSDPFN